MSTIDGFWTVRGHIYIKPSNGLPNKIQIIFTDRNPTVQLNQINLTIDNVLQHLDLFGDVDGEGLFVLVLSKKSARMCAGLRI